MRITRRLGGVLLVGVLAASTLVAAEPAQAHTGHWTVAAFKTWSTNKYTGPNQWTKYQRGRITGWTRDTHVDSRVQYVATKAWHQYANPTGATRVANAHVSPDGGRYSAHFSWPWDWDWGHFFGKLADKLGDCATGALTATLPAMGSTLAVNAIFRGGKIFVGPSGYAAIAIGGCIAAIIG